MKEKGDRRLVPSLALALAAHALLLLLFLRFLPRGVETPPVALVEIQVSGGGAPGAPEGALPAKPRRASAPRTAVRTTTPELPAPVPAPAAPSPVPAATSPVPAAPSPAPVAPPAETPPQSASADAEATPASSASAVLPGATGGGGTGAAGQGGGAGGSGAGGSDIGPPEDSGEGPGVAADINPTPLRPIAVPYPPSARKLGQEGLVKVLTEIDKDGTVTAGRIASSSGFGSLDNSALDAVKSTRFMPAMKNGKPVASRIIIPIRFRLTPN